MVVPKATSSQPSAVPKSQSSEWPQNALRHRFGSYHLAHFKDVAKLALDVGNSKHRGFGERFDRGTSLFPRPLGLHKITRLQPATSLLSAKGLLA